MKFIVTGDNHLRADLPECRLDADWIATQKADLDFIVEQCNKFDAHFLCTGDLFDVPRVPPVITTMFLDAMSQLRPELSIYVIAGNHSLSWHKIENTMESSIGILPILGKTNPQVKYLDAVEYTENGRFEHSAYIEPDLLVVHTLTFPKSEDIPYGANATSAYALLEKYPEASVIFTGDYHHSFEISDDGRLVINPGCMNVQTADMLDYQPKICYIDTDERVDVTTKHDANKVWRWKKSAIQWIDIPKDDRLLTRDHLKRKEERDSRIASFVETIHKDGQIGLSFESNLGKFVESNNLEQDVRDILDEVREEAV